MLEAYFDPVSPDIIRGIKSPYPPDALGQHVQAYTTDSGFPSFEGARLAILGVGEDRGVSAMQVLHKVPILSENNFTS